MSDAGPGRCTQPLNIDEHAKFDKETVSRVMGVGRADACDPSPSRGAVVGTGVRTELV